MRIEIESDDGVEVEIQVHQNGRISVRVDGAMIGSGRWEKIENKLRISLPAGVFGIDDTDSRLHFELE